MEPRLARRSAAVLAVCVGVLGPLPGGRDRASAGLRRPDPAQVIPLDQVAPSFRDGVAEVIRDAHFHRQGKAETFPCNPKLYLKLLNEPALTLALWQDLGPSPARLQQVGPSRFQGSDGSGASASWEYVLRSPRLNVMLCELDYSGPRGNSRLQGRIVLIVRTNYFRENSKGELWIKHELEAFVKVDTRGWKAVAVTVRPLIEKLLEDQIQEAGWFVSLMGRLVEVYPDWAISTTEKQTHLPDETRSNFIELVKQTKRPGAFTGRPVMAK